VIERQLRGNEQPSDHAPVVVQLSWPPADDDPEEGLEDGLENGGEDRLW
jgi:exodeoxyribonuclease-3